MTVTMASAGIPMEAGEKCTLLLKKSMRMIDEFDPKKTTVDAWFEDATFLKDKKLAEVELKFIHQVFYGCIRYKKFLSLFVTSFLYRCPAVALRTEQTLYTILAYMLFFRLSELGPAEFRQFITCGVGTMSSMLALMQYALSVEELEKWVKVEWCKHYDVSYIEQDIIGKLQSFAEELRPIVEEVEYKATGMVKVEGQQAGMPIKSDREPTKIKPFNLTKVRPRLIPEPEVINREVKAQPIPANLNKQTLAEVEAAKTKRREQEKARIATKYDPQEAFSLKTAVRRDYASELEKLKEEVEAERMEQCTFQPKAAKPYVPPAEDAVVRQTAASVLREDALLKQKQAKEYQILKRYEEDLHDASEFNRWQEKMKEKDHLEEEERVHKRIVEMQLTREAAIDAQEAAQRRKHILAEHQREELHVDLEIKEQELAIDLEAKKQVVAETQETRDNARLKEAEVVKAREENAAKIRKEREADFERKRREDEQEMERRKDLIKQIRALEKAPVEKYKMFDPAEPPCQGLLEEMSYAELKERLKIAESRREKEIEDKRERQLAAKLEKQHELIEKAETLAKIRERAREETAARHDNAKRQKAELEVQKKLHRDACIEEVAEKIQLKKKKKREEEMRLKRELKEISMKRQFLAANAEMVESKAHAEQHAGLDREARDRQRITLIEQRKLNEIKVKEAQIRRDNKSAEEAEYRVMQQAVTDRVLRAKEEDIKLKEDILRASKSARNVQKAHERRMAEEIGHSSNAYMKRLTMKSQMSQSH
eukprot:TRINITY_DN1176_c0_g1_i1.p1 TRINITY_DN1176_c0_g1~~TRINITY_DN1176_c0_g1_i1.p1  ORF type:complete len:770 (+),score=247.82 TRINITY_DN1176_c0_g1_i1:59-2368(+)